MLFRALIVSLGYLCSNLRILGGATTAHTVVRVLAFFHQFGSSSIHPSVDSICELSLLLVLLFTLRVFSPCSPVFSSPPKTNIFNSNSNRNGR